MDNLTGSELRECLRDLLALATLPSIWIDADARQITMSLTEALLSALRCDVVYVRIATQNQQRLEAARVSWERGIDPAVVAAAVTDLLGASGSTSSAELCGHQLQCASNGVGMHGEHGVVLAGAERPDFPTDVERLLLRVATNQAAVAIRNALHFEELQEASRAREQLYQQLSEALRRRDEFLAMLGHELRNPLAAMVAARDLENRSSTARASEIIDRQLPTLVRLVDDLLDVSRVNSGKIGLELERVDLNSVVFGAHASCEHAAKEQGQELVCELLPAPVWVLGDRIRLEQVFINIISNATRYTKARGHIRVRISHTSQTATVRVMDDGIGIPAELLPNIFESFVQADTSLDRAKGGLGLGLPIVKGLVTLHGGEVSAHSAGAGQGSEFVVTLPIDQSAERPLPVVTAPVRAATSRPLRVLLVDDNADMLDMLQALLETWGHTTLTARHGIEGVEKALSGNPDVAFIDIGLPGLNGYDVARRIRAGLTRRVKLIALTGYGRDEDRERARESGFDAHLVKPVLSAQLAAVLASCMNVPASDAL